MIQKCRRWFRKWTQMPFLPWLLMNYAIGLFPVIAVLFQKGEPAGLLFSVSTVATVALASNFYSAIVDHLCRRDDDTEEERPAPTRIQVAATVTSLIALTSLAYVNSDKSGAISHNMHSALVVFFIIGSVAVSWAVYKVTRDYNAALVLDTGQAAQDNAREQRLEEAGDTDEW